MKVNLEGASYQQVIAGAKRLGLDVQYGVTKQSDAVALIRAAYPDVTEIEVDAAEPVAQQATAPVPTEAEDGPTSDVVTGNPADFHNDPKVEVNIASDPLSGGKRHHPIAVNGETILVARDTWVSIPYRFYVALENAVVTEFEQIWPDGIGRPETTMRDQHTVRFSSRGGPSAAEIEAWEKRTADVAREPARQAA